MDININTQAWEAVWQRVQQSGQTEKPVYPAAEIRLEQILCEKRDSILWWESFAQKVCFQNPDIQKMICEKRRQWRRLAGWFFLNRGAMPVCDKQKGEASDAAQLCLRRQYEQEKLWAVSLQKLSQETDCEEEKKEYQRAAKEDTVHAEWIRNLIFSRISFQ